MASRTHREPHPLPQHESGNGTPAEGNLSGPGVPKVLPLTEHT